ncbi:MAG: FMN-binding glutamate synthase family protein [Gammaproteobacteria bacterium]|nr:FMN-binding glutamate synthase family protein [Gammaproteobacteria bacterium]
MLSNELIATMLNTLAVLFIFFIGLLTLVIIVTYFFDVFQTKQAIRRNYPVIGHFRYFFEHVGTFFRQYFFSADREELPFNRAERSWVYRAAKNLSNTVAFGSTRDLKPVGSVFFVNCPFPTLADAASEPEAIIIGSDCEQPYTAHSIINISGMSYGAISKPAVLALSTGAKKANCWMNTGEGGLSPYHLRGGADIVFQIGTAKYGVRDDAGNLSDDKLRQIAKHKQVKMFEIKMSQGAKPGKGGILPASKVTQEIAQIRGIPALTDSISPNRHPDINSIDDLLDMIERVRTVTGKPVGFKMVLGAYGWLDDLCSAINQRGQHSAPDFITLDSADGGTGAAPMSLIDYVGLPISESLPLLIDALNQHGLRSRIRVIASGKLINPANVAWALCVGADFISSARGFMFALGCIQALQCNKNTCPTGITTHNKKLQKGLDVETKSERVKNFAENLVHEVCVISHSVGVNSPRELKRIHARVVQNTGRSVPLNEVYPDIITAQPADNISELKQQE